MSEARCRRSGPKKIDGFRTRDEEACFFVSAHVRVVKSTGSVPTAVQRAMMVMAQRNMLWMALLVALVAKSGGVAGFCTAPPGCAAGRHIGRAVSDSASTRQSQSSTRTVLGSALTDFGELLGDQVASTIVSSPIYPLLIGEAKNTMKKSAQVRFHAGQLAGGPFPPFFHMFCFSFMIVRSGCRSRGTKTLQ